MGTAFLSNTAVILALAYLIFPIDLIPDLLGPLGRLDDLCLLLLVGWRSLRKKARQQRAPQQANVSEKDPYTVFGLEPGATRAEVEARFRELAKDYHPDRVAHLGEELRKVAHEKMIEIQNAYAAISRSAKAQRM